VSHEQLTVVLELDSLNNDRLLDAQQGTPYPGTRTPFSAHRFLTVDKPET
jgi:hypothetical protein